ncbi:MAG TPA: thiamine phosphate synthase [Solirubrobacteraceae bacterium]|jgi:thiamine-phosphate pyrophosphorylase
MDSRRQRLQQARLYLVCDIRDDALIDGALRGGVDIVQLRDKHADDATLVVAGRRYAALCAARGALFILNDRPDLVADAHADGVHIGQDDQPVATTRELVGSERIVGLSTHTPEQIATANGSDVDYIGVGPVHATPTKPGRPAVGTALVREAAAHAVHPFFAIGGVDAATATAVREAGAERIAVVRAITDAGDPEAAARELRAAICGSGPEVRVARA